MDQYSILGRIGEGAHGIVFKAKHIEVVHTAVSPVASVHVGSVCCSQGCQLFRKPWRPDGWIAFFRRYRTPKTCIY